VANVYFVSEDANVLLFDPILTLVKAVRCFSRAERHGRSVVLDRVGDGNAHVEIVGFDVELAVLESGVFGVRAVEGCGQGEIGFGEDKGL